MSDESLQIKTKHLEIGVTITKLTNRNNMEEAFKCMDSLECEAGQSDDFDGHDMNLMQALQYFFGNK